MHARSVAHLSLNVVVASYLNGAHLAGLIDKIQGMIVDMPTAV